ncbi:DUF3947 family protein [Bacillus pacificus]|nr:DUF3947 family protein [Bacillus pacificus]NRR19205.1 DUF3947 family protein [Bacillus pacificus]
MFYSYFDSQARTRPYGTVGITFSGMQSTIQAAQQALQSQQQMQQQMQQGTQPHYSSMEYYYPMYHTMPYEMPFSMIPYGTVSIYHFSQEDSFLKEREGSQPSE